MKTKPNIQILDRDFTIHRMHPDENLPAEILQNDFYWIGKTDEELSIICETSIKLKSMKSDSGWIAFKLIGPFDFSEIGIISGITKVLADALIGIFAVSTYDTDYILVKKKNIEKAVDALRENGYSVEPEL